MASVKNYLIIVEGAKTEQSIFEYVLPQYDLNVVINKEKLNNDCDFTKTTFSNDKENVIVIEGPKNRIKDVLHCTETNTDINRLFEESTIFFAGIFLVYDVDHNDNEILDAAYQKFNNTSDGLLILNVPCVEVLAEYDFERIFESNEISNYKSILNDYYSKKQGVNAIDYVKQYFNFIMINFLEKNFQEFYEFNSEWEVEDVSLHPFFLKEMHSRHNEIYSNSFVRFRYFATVLYVIIANIKGFFRNSNNYQIVLEYFKNIEIKVMDQEYSYITRLVDENLTSFTKINSITHDELKTKKLLSICKDKEIISKNKNNQKKVLVTKDELKNKLKKA